MFSRYTKRLPCAKKRRKSAHRKNILLQKEKQKSSPANKAPPKNPWIIGKNLLKSNLG